MFAGPKMRVVMRALGPAAASCPRTIDVKRQRFFVHPSTHRRNSDFGPSPLRACGANTAEPHIRSPLLAAAPKFLIPDVDFGFNVGLETCLEDSSVSIGTGSWPQSQLKPEIRASS